MKPTPLLCACVLAVLASGPAAVQDVRATARFSRTDDVRAELCKRFESAKRTIDVAVFTFTDGKLADALAAASGGKASPSACWPTSPSTRRGATGTRRRCAGSTAVP